jgi:hypothetical protein
MNALLQLRAHRRAGPIVAYSDHIVFTTVAGQGWLVGPKPSLDASKDVAGPPCFIKHQQVHRQERRPLWSYSEFWFPAVVCELDSTWISDVSILTTSLALKSEHDDGKPSRMASRSIRMAQEGRIDWCV